MSSSACPHLRSTRSVRSRASTMPHSLSSTSMTPTGTATPVSAPPAPPARAAWVVGAALGRFRGALARHHKSASTPPGPCPGPSSSAPTGPAPPATSRVFGVPLSESVRIASAEVPSAADPACNARIPYVVVCIGSLLKAHAVQVEGVFRKVGSQRRMRELQAEFEVAPHFGRQVNFGLDPPSREPYYTVHDAACVLRRYLTSLPDPLVPRDLWMDFRQAVVASNPEYYGFSPAPDHLARPSVDNWTAASTASGGQILAPNPSVGSPIPASAPCTAPSPTPPSSSPLTRTQEADAEMENAKVRSTSSLSVPASSAVPGTSAPSPPPPPEVLRFRQLLAQCPRLNRDLISYLLELLAVFANNHQVNFMTAANLAVIFQPSFFNHPSLLTHPEEHRIAVHALELLIIHHQALLPAAGASSPTLLKGRGAAPWSVRQPALAEEESEGDDVNVAPPSRLDDSYGASPKLMLSAPYDAPMLGTGGSPPVAGMWRGASKSTAALAASASLGPLYRSSYTSAPHHPTSPDSALSGVVPGTAPTTPTTITTSTTDGWGPRRISEQTNLTWASHSASAYSCAPRTSNLTAPKSQSSEERSGSPFGPPSLIAPAPPLPQALPFLATAPARHHRKAHILSTNLTPQLYDEASPATPTGTQPKLSPAPSVHSDVPAEFGGLGKRRGQTTPAGTWPKLPEPATASGAGVVSDVETGASEAKCKTPAWRNRKASCPASTSGPGSQSRRKESWANRLLGRNMFSLARPTSSPPASPSAAAAPVHAGPGAAQGSDHPQALPALHEGKRERPTRVSAPNEGSPPSRSGSASGRSLPSRSASCRSAAGGASRAASHRSTHSTRLRQPSSRLVVLN